MRSKPEVVDVVDGIDSNKYSTNDAKFTLGMVHLNKNVMYTFYSTQWRACVQSTDANKNTQNKYGYFIGTGFYREYIDIYKAFVTNWSVVNGHTSEYQNMHYFHANSINKIGTSGKDWTLKFRTIFLRNFRSFETDHEVV